MRRQIPWRAKGSLATCPPKRSPARPEQIRGLVHAHAVEGAVTSNIWFARVEPSLGLTKD